MALALSPLAAAELSFLFGAIAIMGASMLQLASHSSIYSQQINLIATGSLQRPSPDWRLAGDYIRRGHNAVSSHIPEV